MHFEANTLACFAQNHFEARTSKIIGNLTTYNLRIRCWTPSQNTLILLNKNPKIYESVLDKEVNIGQKAYDFPMVSQAAFEN